MMNFEEWLQKKQKVTMSQFLGVTDKKPTYKAYDEYRCRLARFQVAVQTWDCKETAKELIALG